MQELKNTSRQGLQTVLAAESFSFEGARQVRFDRGERIQERKFLLEVQRVLDAPHQIDFVPLSDPNNP